MTLRKKPKKRVGKTRRIYVRRPVLVGMLRRIEVWRPVNKLTPEEIKDAKEFRLFGDVEKALIDVDERELDFDDLIVDGGLNALCGQAFDSSGNRPAVFNYIAIGTDDTAPSTSQTALGSESMRVQGTYSKDANTGECSMDGTFDITATLALNETGLFNDPSAGTMYCRDTYTTKNVVDGDTVKVYYTPKFQLPA